MSRCLDYDDFAAFLDARMSKDERRLALLHMSQCSSCRALGAQVGCELPQDPALLATQLASDKPDPAFMDTVAVADAFSPLVTGPAPARQPADGENEEPAAGRVSLHAEPLLGQVILGYRVRREIGRGGMGAVYEAVHERMGQRAAVKVMFPEFSSDPEFMRRFRAEARAASIVHHPGLVTIFNHGQLPSGMAFIMMEYLQGESLRRRMENGTLGRMDALRLLRQIASALCAVHEHGITHRDLKPENVMIVPDADVPGGQRIKVVDFGIAKTTASLISHVTGGGSGEQPVFLGTVAYASPEQCQMSSRIDSKSDVYSLGVMLYELLGGELPFTGTVTEVLAMHIGDAPRPLRELRKDIPRPLQDLVSAMLAKSPASRPKMAEVRSQLEQFLASSDKAPIARPMLWSVGVLGLAAALATLLYVLAR